MKILTAERNQHQEKEFIDETRRSNKHYQTMIFGILEHMKQTGMTKHNTTINFIQCQVQLNTKYHNDDYRCHIRSLLLLARKTDSVNCDVCHLYSLQKMITLDNIDHFYPVNIETRLSQNLYSKSCWIQCTELAIYYSLNRSKRNSQHSIWSTITRKYNPK